MKQAFISSLLGCFRWSLRLYPRAFRAEFGAEMEVVFATAVQEAGEEGMRAVAAVCLKEAAEFPANLAVAHKQAAYYNEVSVMKREAKWNVWPAWVGLNLLSIPLAILIALALVVLAERTAGPVFAVNGSETVGILQPLLYGAMLILVMAVLQWLLLRRYLPHAELWIPLTALGWLCGIALLYLAWSIGFKAPAEWNVALVFPLFGLLVGAAQWLYLHRVIDRAGCWVLASTVGYGMLARSAFGSFTFIPESLFFILAPFATTGLALVLLLRQEKTIDKEQITKSGKRMGLAFLAVLLLIPLFFVASWVYATGQLTLAKAEGIYATPEEGMKSRLLRNAGDRTVESVEISRAGVNSHDGSQPHVWFVIAYVRTDPREDGYGGGSYFLRVEEGWVHVPEGAFPEFIGWVMELYNLEGADSASSANTAVSSSSSWSDA